MAKMDVFQMDPEIQKQSVNEVKKWNKELRALRVEAIKIRKDFKKMKRMMMLFMLHAERSSVGVKQ